MTTFNEILSRLKDGNITPDEIVEFRNFCAAQLFYYYEQYAKCLSFGAEWVTKARETYKSQAECERAYSATVPGKRETLLKYRIKGVEVVSEALTSLYFQANKEMKEAIRT